MGCGPSLHLGLTLFCQPPDKKGYKIIEDDSALVKLNAGMRSKRCINQSETTPEWKRTGGKLPFSLGLHQHVAECVSVSNGYGIYFG